MTDLSDKSAVMTAIFIHRTNAAVKIRLAEDARPQDDFWVPMSQITQIMTDDAEGSLLEYHQLDPHTSYLWRITGWIALKLFDCDGWDELVEADLSFLDCD